MNKVKLGDIAKSQTGPFGSQLHEEDYVEVGTPIVTVEHLGDIGFTTQNLPFVSEEDVKRLSKFLLEEGDIVFSRVGSVDRSVYTQKEQEGWLFSGRCIRVRCDKSKVNPRYLSYYFKLPSFKEMMLNISVGATMPSLNTRLMDGIDLNLLDINVQGKIAILLDSIDSKIENNNKINAELESMARTIYDYWFLQFDFPDENGKPYKSSGGKMVWNEELKREIPDRWEVLKLDKLCDFSNGINYDKNQEGNRNYKIVNVRNITASTLLLDSSDFDDINLLSTQANKYIIEKNDILIARSGTPGAVRLLLSDEEDIIYCGFIIKCSPKNINQRLFVTYALKKLEGSNATTTGGSIMQNVSQETLKQVNICLPSDEIIEKYNKVVTPLLNKMQQIICENQELTSLRDFLLPLLMNGQVGFKN